MKILILGVNGFIGNSLVKKIMETTEWEVFGIDFSTSKLSHSINNPRFHFIEGDITIHLEWVEYHIKKCDIVIPLVAIATPVSYIKEPLKVFELGFEENLRVVRLCVKYGKRILFPSTSEIYGMCNEKNFSEDNSNFILGPIKKQRWIYSCAKQLLDRIIWAYGKENKLDFTLFRPFNWIGPKLDDIYSAKIGSSRVVTQFIIDIVRNKPIRLVDGGMQKRCFTYIDDGVDCLIKIIENKSEACRGEIFNIGNPNNECSIIKLAEKLIAIYREHPETKEYDTNICNIIKISSEDFYGEGYQDISSRKPSIKKARELLGWNPIVNLDVALKKTLDFFIKESKVNGLI